MIDIRSDTSSSAAALAQFLHTDRVMNHSVGWMGGGMWGWSVLIVVVVVVALIVAMGRAPRK